MKTVPKLLLLGLLASCTNAQPCVDCPAVWGVWFLQYVAPDFPCDAGTPADPPTTVSFTQEGSVLRAAIDGVQVVGTLFDTYDFTLSGQLPGGNTLVTVRGTYLPGSTADAGNERLQNGVLVRSTGACRDDRRFTGARY